MADEGGDAEAADGGGDGDAHEHGVEGPEDGAKDEEGEERVEERGDAAVDAGGKALGVLVHALGGALHGGQAGVPARHVGLHQAAAPAEDPPVADQAGDGVDDDGRGDDPAKVDEAVGDLGAHVGAPLKGAGAKLDGLLQEVVEAAVPLVEGVLEVGFEGLVAEEDGEAEPGVEGARGGAEGAGRAKKFPVHGNGVREKQV